jgi:hypothetical protein
VLFVRLPSARHGAPLTVKAAAPPAPELNSAGKPPPADWIAIMSPIELYQRAAELPDAHLIARARVIFAACGKLLPDPPSRPAIMEALLGVLGFSREYARAVQQAPGQQPRRNA